MPPITWKSLLPAANVAASVKQQSNGVETIMNAFDPIENLMSKTQTMRDENEVQRGVNLNQRIASEIQNENDLGALNQRQAEGQFKDSVLREEYGYLYDAAAKEKAFNTAQGRLRDEFTNSIMSEVNAAGDEGLSLTDSAIRFEELARAGGMGAAEIKKRQAKIMNDPTRQAQYDKKISDFTQNIFTSIPKGERPKTHDAIRIKVAELSQEHGNLVDADRLSSQFQKGLAGRTTDEATLRATQARQKKEAFEAADGSYYSNLSSGMSHEQALKTELDKANPDHRVALAKQLTNTYDTLSGLSTEDQNDVKFYNQEMTNKISAFERSSQAKISSMQATDALITAPISDTTKSKIAGIKAKGGSILQSVKKDVDSHFSDGVINALFGGPDGVTTGTAAFTHMSTKYRDLLKIPGVSMDDAASLVDQAYQNTYDQNQTTIGQGVNTTAFDGEIQRLTGNLKQKRANATEIAQQQETYLKQMERLSSDKNRINRSIAKGLSKQNVTTGAFNPETLYQGFGAELTAKPATPDTPVKNGIGSYVIDTIGEQTNTEKPVVTPESVPDPPKVKTDSLTIDDIKDLGRFTLKNGQVGEQGTTILSGIQKLFTGDVAPPQFSLPGEGDNGSLEMMVRTLGIENDLQKQKNIAEGLRDKYPQASEKDLIALLTKWAQKP